MLINLSKEQIKHIIEALEADRLSAIEYGHASEDEFWQDADKSARDYIKRTDQLLQQLSKVRADAVVFIPSTGQGSSEKWGR